MSEGIVTIEALDCLPFGKNADSSIVQAFIENSRDTIFWFSHQSTAEDSPLAEFNSNANGWYAGRFIGESIFNHQGTYYKFTIRPRFGDKVLFRMLEAIFNIKIIPSASTQQKSEDWQHFIRRIIAFIWVQKLANANLHGLPKRQVQREHLSPVIKGKIDIRKSIHPYYSSNRVVSISREKILDDTVAQIIYQAFQIIKSDFAIGSMNIPDSAQEAINQVFSHVKQAKTVSEAEYQSILYKEIYLSWKPLIDFSWDIIKRKQISLKQAQNNRGIGFFIDMAEVWENYVRSILCKSLSSFGWRLRTIREIAYKGRFFQRELIPDMVFERDGCFVIWDAKYKRMKGRPFDVDREDFFQIHTYIQHYLHDKQVIAGGLLYPVLKTLNPSSSSSPHLLNEQGYAMIFHIEGIEVEETITNQPNENTFIGREKEFLNRISLLINDQTTLTLRTAN